jgi:hypothetical protein
MLDPKGQEKYSNTKEKCRATFYSGYTALVLTYGTKG